MQLMRLRLTCLLLLATLNTERSFVAAEERPNVVLIVADYPAYKQRAVRRGRFKYLLDDTTHFLFDLETDIGERRNLAYRHPDVLKELQSAFAAWETELAR